MTAIQIECLGIMCQYVFGFAVAFAAMAITFETIDRRSRRK